MRLEIYYYRLRNVYRRYKTFALPIIVAVAISMVLFSQVSSQLNANSAVGKNRINAIQNTTSSAFAGIIIPLYTSNPSNDWATLATYDEKYPNAKIYAIVNRNSGPGDLNQDFKAGVDSLKANGITVLGYVWTDYGRIPMDQVKAQISQWDDWYQVDGIFFDGMSYPSCGCPGTPEYYAEADNYAESLGVGFTVGNPGTMADMTAYISSVDVISIYENQGLPNTSQLAHYSTIAPKEKWYIIPYNVQENQITDDYINELKDHVGYLYITSEFMPDGVTLNPWTKLPPYFEKLLQYA